jgi:hypothetical protein
MTKIMDKKVILISQKDMIINMLHSGNSFTEMELTKAITRQAFSKTPYKNFPEVYNERGARSFIAILRREGYPIASYNTHNQWTGRVNKAYYWEHNESKYVQWCLNNGYFEFKKGAPK